jgi:hypothetical protein
MPRASRSSQIPEMLKGADAPSTSTSVPSHRGKDANWVPTDAMRQFELMFRAYAPTRALFEKTWVLPDVEKVK